MLARVPVDDKGQFPVNTHLVSALAAGFLFFNQLLFWLLGALLAQQDKAASAVRFFWISAAVALATWCAVAFVQWRERAASTADAIALALALAAHAWMLARDAGNAPALWPMAAANALLIAWSMRGVLRPRKKR